MSFAEEFAEKRTLIGEGETAAVYLYGGYAYKCYKDGFPDEAIAYERHIQNVAYKSGLTKVRYYDGEIPRTAKMDPVMGKNMAERLRAGESFKWEQDFISVFEKIHSGSGEGLPPLAVYLADALEKGDLEPSQRECALKLLSEIPDGNAPCHLDYHFLNILYADGEYTVIDWINAHKGNPVLDYARSYVIMHEFARPFAQRFLQLAAEQGYPAEELDKAVLVMSLHRLTECKSEAVQALAAESYEKFGANFKKHLTNKKVGVIL